MKLSVKRPTLTQALCAALIVSFLLAIAGIAAYLTAAKGKTNSFTVGYEKTEIVEKFDPPDKLTPGISFDKQVQVSNLGTIPVYVRVLVLFSDSDMEDVCTLDYDTSGDWLYNDTDGYWYYTEPLPAGEMTTPLFTEVSLAETNADGSELTEADMEDFEIMIYSESYQCTGEFEQPGKGGYEAAWEYFHRNKNNA